MSEHTPGPWKITTRTYVRSPDGEETVSYAVFASKSGVSTDLAQFIGEEADAQLIVAAPGLLEAAKGILAVLPTSLAVTEDELDALIPLAAAIDKAEGKE